MFGPWTEHTPEELSTFSTSRGNGWMFWGGSWGTPHFQVSRHTYTHVIHALAPLLLLPLSYESIHDLPPAPQINGLFHRSLFIMTHCLGPRIFGKVEKERALSCSFCLALLEKAELTWVYSEREFDHNMPGWVEEALNISWGRYCWAYALARHMNVPSAPTELLSDFHAFSFFF